MSQANLQVIYASVVGMKNQRANLRSKLNRKLNRAEKLLLDINSDSQECSKLEQCIADLEQRYNLPTTYHFNKRI